MRITSTTGEISRLGIKVNDELMKVNGEPVIDLIDFQYLCSEEELDLLIVSKGKERVFHVSKPDCEPLGIELDQSQLLKMRGCRNNCIFCFVNQLPPNCRESLMFKDDDWRFSFIMGNYVTLSNVDDAELRRIIARKVSPLYISVHSTNHQLRLKMLGVKKAPDILEQLGRLAKAKLYTHCQIVICPGINDDLELERTINDLAGLYPYVSSVALVPVGLTAHRQNQPELRCFDEHCAKKTLAQLEKTQREFLETLGTRFVFAADELYIYAKRDPASYEECEDFAQIENGVGLMASFERELDAELELTEGRTTGKFTLVTGTSAHGFMQRMASKISAATGAKIEVLPVGNAFFGESVTVAGLLTGGDIARELENKQTGKVLLPKCMLREFEDVFLDGITLAQLRQRLNREIIVVEVDGGKLVQAVLK